MKQFKTLVALVLALTLTLSLVGAAFADVSLTVSAVDGHSYKYWQLFVGDLAADGETLSNVKWGSDAATSIAYKTKASGSNEFTVDATIAPTAGEAVPAAVLEYLASLASDTLATANTITGWVTGSGTAIGNNTEVPTGYYVIKDSYTDSTAAHDTTLSTNVVEIVGPTQITPKAGTTEHKKEVIDINDTTDVALDLSELKDLDWAHAGSSADYDFGDKIPFKLTTTVASDFAKYAAYYLNIADTMCDGLTLDDDSIVVYVNGTVAKKATASPAANDEYTLTTTDHSFNVEFKHLNGINNVAAGSKVEVYYTATLNADGTDVVIGGNGNENESTATFSNNPNGDQSGTETTPPSTVVVFTYKTVVNKVNNNQQPLVGAEFTLTKKLKNGSTATIAVIKYKADGTTVTTKTANGTAASEGDATHFSFNGLDDGVYVLTETVTPNGYNTIDPVTFKVVAEHSTTGVTSLVVKNEDGSVFSGELTFSATTSTGTIATDVVNQSGTILPTTGGIGTTIFYVAGIVLVLGAAAVIIARRKAEQN